MKVRNSHSKTLSNAANPKLSDIARKKPHADALRKHPKIKEKPLSRGTFD